MSGRIEGEFVEVGRYFEWADSDDDRGVIRLDDATGTATLDVEEDGRWSGVTVTPKLAKKLRKFLKEDK